MAIIQIIHLTQKTYRVPPIAYMVQGDTGRELRMVIDDIELTGNPTAELSFMRADQSFYSVNAEFESQTNSFVADVTQAITQAGTTKAQLKVTSSSKVVSSYTFLIFVEPNTDGLPTEQMGWPLEDIMNAVNELMYGALGLSDDVKEALLDCFAHVAWINDQGQTYYDALEEALYPPVPVSSVTIDPATFQLSSIGATQQLTATIAPSSAQATVTWSSSDTSVATVSESGLVTSVAVGTATITASAGGVDGTAACTVALPTLSSISAVYTQSGTVYDSDSLDSLKDDLVVTATWSDSSTSVVPSTDYTLSGTLTVGTSTVTVSYGGKTTTFTVTVTYLDTTLYNWDLKTSLTDSVGNVTATTTATFTSGTGLVFGSDSKYCDFGETYARDRTYEFDVLSIGSTGSGHRRTLMFDVDALTSQGGAGLIFSSNKGGWIFYTGTAWDSSTIVSGTDKYNIFDGKTVKVELDSNGIASVYSKTIGADDSTYTFVGSSTNALKDYTNGHVYLGSSSSDYLAPATFTGFRIKEGSRRHAWQAETAAAMPHGWESEPGMAAADTLQPLLE